MKKTFPWTRFNCIKATEPLPEDSLPLSTLEFLVPIWLTSEGWNAESILEPPSGIERGTHGPGIQRPKHWAIAP